MSVKQGPRRYWRRSQTNKNQDGGQKAMTARQIAAEEGTSERSKGFIRLRWAYIAGCLGLGVLVGFLVEIYSVRQAGQTRAAALLTEGSSTENSYHSHLVLEELHSEGKTTSDSSLAYAQTPSNDASNQIPGIPQSSLPDYPAAGKDAGVYNEGQAAFWDLPLIDFFKFFGPEQRAQGYRPEQPINFSHIVHVQQNKMECQYCHWSVGKASYAALPDVESCMGCHKLVKGRDEQSQAEIKKLEEYYSKGEPIPWVKVHVMPNHYKFNHKRHVKAGVSCHECHGQVGEMPVVERVSSMKMGWCVSCHREQGTSIDCTTCHH